MDKQILLADTVPQTPVISGRMTLITMVVLVLVAMYIRPKSNNVAEGSATTGVTTQVVVHGFVGR
jgi:hypothetical protein